MGFVGRSGSCACGFDGKGALVCFYHVPGLGIEILPLISRNLEMFPARVPSSCWYP